MPTPIGAPVALMSKKSPFTPATAPVRATCCESGVRADTVPGLRYVGFTTLLPRSTASVSPRIQPAGSNRSNWVRFRPGATSVVALPVTSPSSGSAAAKAAGPWWSDDAEGAASTGGVPSGARSGSAWAGTANAVATRATNGSTTRDFFTRYPSIEGESEPDQHSAVARPGEDFPVNAA